MSLLDRVSEELKQAQLAQEEERLLALRSIRAAFLNEMKKDGSESLDDEVCVALLRRLAKQRKESIEAFEKAGRGDRVEAEQSELAVIESYLPSLADEATTRDIVRAAIEQTGAQAPGDVGRVMGAVMKAHRGEVDGTLAKRIADEILGG